MKNKLIGITAIIGIVVLEVIALSKGIDGKFLILAISSISGIGGYYVGKKY